jgi:hypothetical protein
MSDLSLTPPRPVFAAIAAYGLHGTTLELPVEPFGDDDWDWTLRGTLRHRTIGHLAAAVADGAMPVSAEQFEGLREAHAAVMAQAVVIEQHMLRAVDALGRAGIDHRVLKGNALAHTTYRDPSMRVFGDVDLLTPSETFDDAVAALIAAGYRRSWPQLRPGFDRRFTKAVTLKAQDGRQIDLHRTFLMGPFGLTIDLPALFETSTPFVVAGRKLLALGREEQFLHACYNAALGDPAPRLVSLRDVVELLLAPDLDTDRALAMADDWGGLPVLARAITVAWERFAMADSVPLTVWAQRYEPDRAEQRALDAYLEGDRRYAAKAVASLRVLPGLAAKAAYLRAVALPRRDFIANRRAGGRLNWLRRGRQSLPNDWWRA